MIGIVAPGPEPAANRDPAPGQPPHVLLVVDQLTRTLGGGERILLKIAALLPRYGFRASILAFVVHPESPALDLPPCPIYQLPLGKTTSLAALRGALAYRQFLRQQRIQLVQTFFESSDIWAGLVTKTVPGVRLIWSRRDLGILRTRKHKIAYRLMAALPDAVFAVSDQVRRHAIEVDRIDPARVQTIYNGLDLDGWSGATRPAKPAGDFLVATVGNIRRVKGHDLLLRAAAEVVQQFPNVQVRIGGEVLEPEYRAELQALVADLRLAGHVRFDGGVADVREYLAAADVFVLPSRSEGFSNAIVEAMAARLPVVATEVGGNAEAVEDRMSGILVPPEDPQALAAAILRLIADPLLARAMGARGRTLAEERFSAAAMMNRIAGAYRSLISHA